MCCLICKIIAAERTGNPQHACSTASPSLTTEIVGRVAGIIVSCLCGHRFNIWADTSSSRDLVVYLILSMQIFGITSNEATKPSVHKFSIHHSLSIFTFEITDCEILRISFNTRKRRIKRGSTSCVLRSRNCIIWVPRYLLHVYQLRPELSTLNMTSCVPPLVRNCISCIESCGYTKCPKIVSFLHSFIVLYFIHNYTRGRRWHSG